MSDENEIIVGRYEAGTVDQPKELDELIERVWIEAVEDQQESARIAAILGIPATRLRSVPTPVRTKIAKAGLTGAEVEIALVGAFVIAVAKEIGKVAGQTAGRFTVEEAKKLWVILRRRLRKSEPEALGEESTPDDG
jgi:hypothetical protein